MNIQNPARAFINEVDGSEAQNGTCSRLLRSTSAFSGGLAIAALFAAVIH